MSLFNGSGSCGPANPLQNLNKHASGETASSTHRDRVNPVSFKICLRTPVYFEQKSILLGTPACCFVDVGTSYSTTVRWDQFVKRANAFGTFLEKNKTDSRGIRAFSVLTKNRISMRAHLGLDRMG